MPTYRFGHITVDVGDGYTVTTLADGSTVTAEHAEQPGQAVIAAELGYASAVEMNVHHDLAHSLLAHMIGLDASPTLKGVSSGQHFKYWQFEEAAVLALQAYCKVAGVDMAELAERYSTGETV